MASKKQKRISKAWVADYENKGTAQYKVAIQPLGDWVVVVHPQSGRYSVTHRITGLMGHVTYSFEEAEKLLGVWARCERFTMATWTKRLEKVYKRARDKALRS